MSMSVTVGVHMYPATPIRARVHPEENRVVLRLEGSGQGWAELLVFADRAELVRLADVLSATLAELDEKRAELERKSAA
jgi:hypothetical protein